MDVYPAIDIKGGNTIWGGDPLEEARAFVAEGARWLHVVDMDQAFRTGRDNSDLVRKIAAIGDVSVELGGNLTDPHDVSRALDGGIDRVVYGTRAAMDPALLERLLQLAGEPRSAVAIDVRRRRVALRGRPDTLAASPTDLARQVSALGVATVLYRDLDRDGGLEGADLEGAQRLYEETGLQVIVAGGVATLDEVTWVAEAGLAGVVVGRAFHEGRFTLREALGCCGSSA